MEPGRHLFPVRQLLWKSAQEILQLVLCFNATLLYHQYQHHVYNFSPLLILPEPEKDPDPELGSLAFKTPPIWKGNPELWLMQLESQFVTA
ncbi:hypothetical protein AVEN_121095-1 [Araneus ventricosus]|uniref:Uncharacterized protein n=1 Tax=Araneus ventricosus TaxID=182803 RepID=A0A4Y2M0A1_ARAVE|nr:hypothetical protein AVEN_121095-1 [Araneus ventricosus]